MRKIILDCDTGDDDACAITLAAASRELELLGVTAVMGNLPLEQTYRNALKAFRIPAEAAKPLSGQETVRLTPELLMQLLEENL